MFRSPGSEAGPSLREPIPPFSSLKAAKVGAGDDPFPIIQPPIHGAAAAGGDAATHGAVGNDMFVVQNSTNPAVTRGIHAPQ